jgi:phage-related protein
MATALGEDTKSASIQLGKALQDPILGVTALRRVGVNFNNDQREVIKNLVETGHQLDAQKLILKELNVEFGGSAAAAATTYQGRLKQLENTFNDTKEVVGRFIVNGIYPFIQATIPLAQAVLKLVEGNGSWSDIHKALLTQFPQLTAAINLIWNTIQKAFTPVVKELNEIWAKHKEELVLIGQFIGGTLLIVLSALIVILGKLIEIVLQVVNAFLNFVEFIKKPVSEALDLLNKGLIATEKFFENLGKTVNSITKSITDAIRGMVTDAINSINKLIDGFNTLGGKIPGVPKISIPHIPGLASGTDYFSGGVALVGEQGAELVNLPQGASVTPADKTASMMGGATVNIYNPVVRSNSDIDMIVDQVRRVLGRDTELARLRAI